MKTSYPNFISAIEKYLEQQIRRCYPMAWDEDHITFSIVQDLSTEFSDVSIEGLDRPFKLKWDARKLRRPAEETLGDLAIIIHLETWDGETVEGIGAVEAKKRARGKSSFDAAKKSQLQRICARAPHSHLLLYDSYEITGFADNLETNNYGDGFSYSSQYVNTVPYSYCVTMPINIALSVGSYKISLYKFCMPFSIQLCTRYFRGYDLEMDSTILKDVKNNNERNGGFRYLWLIGVSTGEKEPRLPSDINDDFYGPLEN